MITTETLESFLRDQWKIIVDLNICVRNLDRLKNEKYEFEEDIKRHGFFRHHWHQLKFISVIQVSKLFSSRANDKRSFIKLCNLLDSTPFDTTLLARLDENKTKSNDIAHSRDDIAPIILRTRKALESEEALVHKFLTARDTVFELERKKRGGT